MKNNFAIGIPTLNRADLLNPTLTKYFKQFPNTDIYIIDNGNQSIVSRSNNYNCFNAPENFGVSKILESSFAIQFSKSMNTF